MSRVQQSGSTAKKGGAVAAIVGVAALAVSFIGTKEGLRTTAYRDSVNVPTVCYGETRGIRMGMKFTRPECDAMFVKALDEFANGVEKCVPSIVAAPAERYVAHLSLSYNIGLGAYCGSSVARLTNAGDIRGGCDAFLKWDRAGGRILAGLSARRREERAMCLRGL